LQQIFKNILQYCRLLFFFLRLQIFYSLLLSFFEQKKNNKQNIILNNKIVALCFKVKTIAKKIIAQK